MTYKTQDGSGSEVLLVMLLRTYQQLLLLLELTGMKGNTIKNTAMDQSLTPGHKPIAAIPTQE